MIKLPEKSSKFYENHPEKSGNISICGQKCGQKYCQKATLN